MLSCWRNRGKDGCKNNWWKPGVLRTDRCSIAYAARSSQTLWRRTRETISTNVSTSACLFRSWSIRYPKSFPMSRELASTRSSFGKEMMSVPNSLSPTWKISRSWLTTCFLRFSLRIWARVYDENYFRDFSITKISPTQILLNFNRH